MPPHPDRVRLNYICPFCKGFLSDGKHSVERFGINDTYGYFIGCPKHPKYEVTMITSELNERT